MQICGYPDWTLKRRNRRKKNDDEQRAVISIPYVKGTSEKLAKTYRKYGIGVIHKPSQKLKGILCKNKDPVHKMERPGVNYLISCKKHPDQVYIGETERSMKFRGYEHGIVPHKDLSRNLSIPPIDTTTTPTNNAEETNNRRSSRLKSKTKHDYKLMNQGVDLPSGNRNSEVAQYISKADHKAEDMEIRILNYEQNWWKRGIREAIHIRRHQPNLNQDGGRYNLGCIWTNLVKDTEKMKTCDIRSDLIGGDINSQVDPVTNLTTEEDQPTGGRKLI